ncbi:competence protein CoiA [Enterococcus mundtii]|uniref:competence protein CoiA n=1 Tax=Enterococcus mundtii TaxID=53346 RepID=UPI000826AFAA|nr:competence protein CoiA family protein [Enterococcus mundtii]
MLLAKDKEGSIFLATDATKECDYYCPNCGNQVFLRRGMKRIAHFFHHATSDCQVFSEAESEEHLNLKRQCFRWLKKSYPRVEMEGYLSQLMQRPDILAGHHAFEIQCSPLSYERMIERTINYKANGYVVWWLLGMKFFKRNDCLRLEKKFCYYDDLRQLHFWQIDWSTQKVYLYSQIFTDLSGKIRFEQSSWSFFEKELLTVLEVESGSLRKIPSPSSVKTKDWLEKQIIRKNKKVLGVQEQCYLRKKHVLYLESWIYEGSDFFCFFSEQVFFYRLLFSQMKCKENDKKTSSFDKWYQEIKEYKNEWLFPLIDEQKIYRLFYEECKRFVQK